MTNQLEMVNGVLRPMSDAEQVAYNALQAAWPAAQAANAEAAMQTALSDPGTQIANLTAALIAANIIPSTALPTAQITAVNNKLSAIGAATISTTATLAAAKIS